MQLFNVFHMVFQWDLFIIIFVSMSIFHTSDGFLRMTFKHFCLFLGPSWRLFFEGHLWWPHSMFSLVIFKQTTNDLQGSPFTRPSLHTFSLDNQAMSVFHFVNYLLLSLSFNLFVSTSTEIVSSCITLHIHATFFILITSSFLTDQVLIQYSLWTCRIQ